MEQTVKGASAHCRPRLYGTQIKKEGQTLFRPGSSVAISTKGDMAGVAVPYAKLGRRALACE